MDDRLIIELYCQRDETAIRKTDEKYGKYCFSIAHNILFDQQDAEECVNDAYLHTWNSIPPIKPISLRCFLARITRNLSINRYKEQRRGKRGSGNILLPLEELGDVVSDGNDIAEEITKNELVLSINRFLYSLPDRDSNIFVKRYYHCCTTREIARMYRLKESNVLKILSRTRERLRQHLLKEGYTI